MKFEDIIGNIKELHDKNEYEVEKIFIKSDDLEKKILRVISENGIEYGIDLRKSGKKLEQGSILFKKGNKLIVVDTEIEKIIEIYPKDIDEMGEIAYALGNMHTPAEIENKKILIHYHPFLEEMLNAKKYTFKISEIKLKKTLKNLECRGHHHE